MTRMAGSIITFSITRSSFLSDLRIMRSTSLVYIQACHALLVCVCVCARALCSCVCVRVCAFACVLSCGIAGCLYIFYLIHARRHARSLARTHAHAHKRTHTYTPLLNEGMLRVFLCHHVSVSTISIHEIAFFVRTSVCILCLS